MSTTQLWRGFGRKAALYRNCLMWSSGLKLVSASVSCNCKVTNVSGENQYCSSQQEDVSCWRNPSQLHQLHVELQCIVYLYTCTSDPKSDSHLVESKEAEVPDDGEGADPRPRGDLSRNLQTDLYNLQRVGKDHLGATSLDEQKDKKKLVQRTSRGGKFSILDWIPELNMKPHFNASVATKNKHLNRFCLIWVFVFYWWTFKKLII